MNQESRIKNYAFSASIIALFLACFLMMVPVMANAQNQGNGLLPDCGYKGGDGKIKECGFNDLIVLVNKIIKYIVVISIPVAAAVFAWAGFNMMIHPANPTERTNSWQMMQKVFIGFVLVLSAWLITDTLRKALVGDKIPNIIGQTNAQ